MKRILQFLFLLFFFISFCICQNPWKKEKIFVGEEGEMFQTEMMLELNEMSDNISLQITR